LAARTWPFNKSSFFATTGAEAPQTPRPPRRMGDAPQNAR